LTGKSAQKMVRVSSRRQRRNKAVRSEVKTNITKAEKVIFSGDLEAARKAVKTAVTSLDKASEKGILHDNNTSRRKSRLLKKLNEVTAQAAPEPEPIVEESEE
jgi:small subunit ribosomal protein S20